MAAASESGTATDLDLISRKEEIEKILELLKEESVKTVILEGDAGVGKTWIAKQISDLAVREGLSYMACWEYLNQRDESKSLHEKIARQLSIQGIASEDNKRKDGKQEDKRLESWTQISDEPERRSAKAKRPAGAEANRSAEAVRPARPEAKRSLGPEAERSAEAMRPSEPEAQRHPVPETERSAEPDPKKVVLFILDGLPDTTEVDFTGQLKYLEKPNERPAYKVLITRRKKHVEDEEMNGVTETENVTVTGNISVIEVGKLRDECLWFLLNKTVTEKVRKHACFSTWAMEIARKSEGLPGPILMIAEALNRIGGRDSETLTFEGALKKAAEREKGPDGINPLLLSVCDMLPRRDRALINCWWHSLYFFQKQGGVHYDELIACWVVEGCLDDIVGVEEAYKEGHRVMIELKVRRLLDVLGDNVVIMGGLAPAFRDYHQDGYERTTSLGLASVFEAADWQVFGRITLADGMIRTPCIAECWEQVTTLITNGSPLPRKVRDFLPPREVRDSNSEPLQGLRVFVLFSPILRSLPSTFSKMIKLRLLVLRGCDLLDDIDGIRELDSLEVLEISGAISLKKMKDEFFRALCKLRSLNLSGAQITSLPSSMSDLTELRWLILRGCSCLGSLPRLSDLTSLEVLDLSGATKLKKFKDPALTSLKKLQMLDLSHTNLERLPILGSLENLTRLSIRCCESLRRPSELNSLSNLQILDLSGAVRLRRIPKEFLAEKKRLKILDLSNTAIGHLPFNFQSFFMLEQLDLSNTKITSLPSLSKLGKLGVLNLSGCSDLKEIGDESLVHMARLFCLDLSETKIKRLESLSNLLNLRQLLLKNCSSLEERPCLETLSKLEGLDLCGVTFPEGTEAKFLERVGDLQFLDLSGTRLKLPLTYKLANLTKLSLQGCSLSETEPNLGECTKLEVLDLSKTGISSLPWLKNLGDLRELKLRDCSELKQLPDLASPTRLEVLDLWGTGIRQVTPGISRLTGLKHLDLPDLRDIEEFDWGSIMLLPEELNWVESGIFKHSEKRPCMLLSLTELSQILRDDPELKDRCFQKFHFFLCARKGQRRDGDIYLHRVDPFIREIYSKTSISGGQRFLEIVGFDSFPAGIEGAFRKARSFSFIDNKYITSLSDVTAGLKERREEGLAMEECILEMCAEMKTIFGTEKTGDEMVKNLIDETQVMMVKNLEILWASNLPQLDRVFSGDAQSESFDHLRELYLDCCPVIKVVFDSCKLPQRLEVLQIKFCDNLEGLFSPSIGEPKLPNLEILDLLELPKLASMGGGGPWIIVDIFPSVGLVRVRECPKLSLKEFESSEALEQLCLDCCPALEAVDASKLPENLEILEIRSCTNLKTLFPPNMKNLLKLRKLHLVELPELIRIGNLQNIVGCFPSLQSMRIKGCQKLSLEKIGSNKDLREVYLDRCPALETLFAPRQLPEKLEILEIRSCTNLKDLLLPKLPKLKKLHLVELPQLTSIGNSENIVGSFPSVQSIRVKECRKLRLKEIGSTTDLRELYLDCCSELEAVFASLSLPENLEILEIRSCDKLKTLFPSNIGKLPKLQKLHLVELPLLTVTGVPKKSSIGDVFPSMRSIKVRRCPKLKDLERFRQLSYASVEDF